LKENDKWWIKKLRMEEEMRHEKLNELFTKLVKYDDEGNPRCKSCGKILHIDHHLMGWWLPFIHSYPVCSEWKENGMCYYDFVKIAGGNKKNCKTYMVVKIKMLKLHSHIFQNPLKT
jgi:hypothetical protein